jgi:hyaluronoglucosaminidase
MSHEGAAQHPEVFEPLLSSPVRLRLVLVGALALLSAAAGVSSPREARSSPLALTPTPRVQTALSGSAKITSTVVVHTNGRSDAASTTDVEKMFTEKGARIRLVHEPAGVPDSLNVYIGRSDAAERRSDVATSASLPPGGYVLVVRRDTIVLDGADGAGQFYATQALGQLLAGGGSLRQLTIRDWPAVQSRGLVEGFYGVPWTTDQRLDVIQWLARHEMNAYVVMPKDDPYVRKEWRSPFSASSLAGYAHLARSAKRFHVDLGVGLSPGDSICYSSSSDEAALLAKLDALWGVGIRRFTVGFDDIDKSLAPCASDVAAFGTGASWLGRAQAAFVTRVERELASRHPHAAPLTFVPTEYSGTTPSAYIDAIAAGLPKDVDVQWTGPFGVSSRITAKDAAAATVRYGHRLLLWDNFYVNDYLPGSTVLGPYSGRPSNLASQIDGVLLDPMNQPELMKLGIATAATYLWNPRTYDPRLAWESAARAVVGDDGDALAALKAVADVDAAPPVAGSSPAPTLAAAFRRFWAQWNAGQIDAAAKTLRPQLVQLRDAPAGLRSSAPGSPLVAAAAPWLDQLEAAAGAAVAALDTLLEHREGLTSKETADAALARQLRERALLQVLPGTTTSVGVAGGALLEFVHYGLRGYGP